MDKSVWITIGVVVALLVAFPLLAQLKRSSTGPGSAPASDTSSSSTHSDAPLAPPTWNSSNLGGTAWTLQGYTVQLAPGGVASAVTPLGTVSGTWTVSGSDLTVSAMGQTLKATISGDQILIKGQPAQRVQ